MAALKRGGRLFQGKGNTSYQTNFKTLFLSFSTMKMKLKTSKPKKKKKKKGKQKKINNSFIVWLFVKPYHMNSYEF